jgi:Aminotransferase class-III
MATLTAARCAAAVCCQRFLSSSVSAFVAAFASTLPSPLSVVYLVNSGSEANDLALRLSRAHSVHRDVVTLEGGYHGHTLAMIQCSPYKFQQQAAQTAPDHVHVCAAPNLYHWRHSTGMKRREDRRQTGNQSEGRESDDEEAEEDPEAVEREAGRWYAAALQRQIDGQIDMQTQIALTTHCRLFPPSDLFSFCYTQHSPLLDAVFVVSSMSRCRAARVSFFSLQATCPAVTPL